MRDADWMEEHFDAWLDDTLEEQDRVRFEDELAKSPELRGEARLARSIDESLRRHFDVPDLAGLCDEVRARAGATAAPSATIGTSVYRWRYALAAATAAACLLIVFWPGASDPADSSPSGTPIAETDAANSDAPYTAFDPASGLGIGACTLHDSLDYEVVTFEGVDAESTSASWQALFQERSAVGAAIGCGSLDSFTESVRAACGSALALPADSSRHLQEVESHPSLGSTHFVQVYLGFTAATSSLVFVDRLERDPRPAAPGEASGLHLFRRTIGPLVVYELTRELAPRVLPALQSAD